MDGHTVGQQSSAVGLGAKSICTSLGGQILPERFFQPISNMKYPCIPLFFHFSCSFQYVLATQADTVSYRCFPTRVAKMFRNEQEKWKKTLLTSRACLLVSAMLKITSYVKEFTWSNPDYSLFVKFRI